MVAVAVVEIKSEPLYWHSLSKHGLKTSAKVFVLSFCSRLCSFVHGQ